MKLFQAEECFLLCSIILRLSDESTFKHSYEAKLELLKSEKEEKLTNIKVSS